MRTPSILLALALVAAACRGPVPGPTSRPSPPASPSATATPQPTAGRSPSPVPSASPAGGFYLRAWFEQALPPDATFAQLPMLTISDGMAIDGNIAIPAIYPGPIFVTPFVRTIGQEGESIILEEARRLGLLDNGTDFTDGTAPGGQIARLLITVDGRTYDLSGRADIAIGDQPGSPEAFAAFWQELSMLEEFVGDELGAVEPYVPARVAVLFGAPAEPEPGLTQQPRTWPLEGNFAEMGVEFPGAPGSRCVTIDGDDLEVVLPVLEQANALTVFLDEAEGQASANAVVVVPGAQSPCGD